MNFSVILIYISFIINEAAYLFMFSRLFFSFLEFVCLFFYTFVGLFLINYLGLLSILGSLALCAISFKCFFSDNIKSCDICKMLLFLEASRIN